MPSIVLLYFAIGCVVEVINDVVFDMNVDLSHNIWPTMMELILEDSIFVLMSLILAFAWPITIYGMIRWRTKYKKESES